MAKRKNVKKTGKNFLGLIIVVTFLSVIISVGVSLSSDTNGKSSSNNGGEGSSNENTPTAIYVGDQDIVF